jgi:hypothetical protein
MRARRAQAIRRPHAQIEFGLGRRDSYHVSGHRECRIASRAPLNPSGAREGRAASEVPTVGYKNSIRQPRRRGPWLSIAPHDSIAAMLASLLFGRPNRSCATA